MKIDLHVHASERSACAHVNEEGQIRAAIAAGLEGFAFTDHNRLVPKARLVELNEKYAPFRIFTGIEVDADQEHWVVLGLHDPALERFGWTYPALFRYVRERGGYIILAHPFRYAPRVRVDLDQGAPDGIEVCSTNTPAERRADIEALAARYSMALFTNSDGHRAGSVGSYYTRLPRPGANDRELIEILRAMRPAN